MANPALQGTIQKNAVRLAAKIEKDGEISKLIRQEVESKIASRLRPVFMWNAMVDELGTELDDCPIVGSGPEGTNNPDRYVKKVTKQGVTKYGSFWEDTAVSLGVTEEWSTYSGKLELAGKADAPADDEIQKLKSQGPKWLEAEKRNVAEKIRTAKELFVTGARIYQMWEKLQEFDTIEVTVVTALDGDGEEVIDTKTTRPFLLRERYAKRGKDGQPLTDNEGNPVYQYTDKMRYMSVGEFVGLAPGEAQEMEGGFSFDNLMKAAAVKRKREQAEKPKVLINNSELFLTYISQTTDYITGDGYEKRIVRMCEEARKDETKLDMLMQHAVAFEAIYEELKPDWERMRQKKREAKNGTERKTA